MRVLVCPDSFSGTLTALEAAEAIAEGWADVRPGDQLTLVGMSDGGLGLLDVVEQATPGAARRHAEVADAAGMAADVSWLRLPDGTALVETAEVVGLHRLDPARRDPMTTTTYGVGQLLAAVAAEAPRGITVGLGGSATVDGGAGMASALSGHALRRADGNAVKVGGRWTGEVNRVREAWRAAGLPPVTGLADVDATLLGPAGAAAVFGPQKGATALGVRLLEEALATYADVVERDLPGGPWRDRPGAGAAGGLGFALLAFLGAEVVPGAAAVADLVGLTALLGGGGDGGDPIDLVITGEGSLDAQTAMGKVVHVVAGLAGAADVPVAVVAGRADPAAATGLGLLEVLGPGGLTDARPAVVRAGASLARRAPSPGG